jgi:beta-glucanase (GH16 family)
MFTQTSKKEESRMKIGQKVLFILVIALAISCEVATPNNPGTDTGGNDNGDEYNWQLVWSDEFDDGVFDTTKWTREAMAPQTVNLEWQEYTTSETHSWEEDGNMVLKLSYDGPSRSVGNYTSARINSADKFEFTYGKISARIRIDYMEQGVWPAFWLLGASCNEYGGTVPWPECGEVDILEIIGGTDGTSGKDREKEAWSTMHWSIPPGPTVDNQNIGRKYENGMLVLNDKIWGSEYHTYEVIWDEEYISASIDGNIYFTGNIEDVNKSEFHEDFFIILNIACGGNWPGDPTLEQDVHMYIDWIRVFEEDSTTPYEREVIGLRNGTFDSSPEYWQPIGFNWEYGWPAGWDQTRASYDVVNGEYICDLIYAAENWNPKIRQTNLTFFNQHNYTLKFDARSLGVNRTMYVHCGPSERDLGGDLMYLNQTVPVTTTMQSYEYTFTATDTIFNGGLFFLVGEENVDVVLDNIELIDNTDSTLY